MEERFRKLNRHGFCRGKEKEHGFILTEVWSKHETHTKIKPNRNTHCLNETQSFKEEGHVSTSGDSIILRGKRK